jgi:N-acetylmuramoyl-L-alanine amidase
VNTSLFELLKKPGKLVLCAGHGGADSGAVFGKFEEAKETVYLVDAISAALKARKLTIEQVPRGLALKGKIAWVNKNYGPGDAWALEIHRDSSEGITEERASKTCGVYCGDSQGSVQIGAFIRDALRRFGADERSWALSHRESRFGSLGWIHQTKPVAHLIELGFIEGRNDNAHLDWLAGIAAKAIYEAFSGHAWGEDLHPDLIPAAPKEAHPEAPNVPSPAGSRIEALADVYRVKDMGTLFKKLKVKVSWEDYDDLRQVTLAQWILESGRGESDLARLHLNFAGLKWRPEMESWAQPVDYEAHDGKVKYCKFSSQDAFIEGYWRFLMRPVYDGWNTHTNPSREFIRFLLACGYTESNTYLDEVTSLVPSATLLLSRQATPISAPIPGPVNHVKTVSDLFARAKGAIVIDPGHGGNRQLPGSSPNNATARPSNTLEKTMTLDMGLRIRKQLDTVAPNVTVYLTRDRDENVAGAKRAALAREKNADLFLSIHFNDGDKRVRGVEAFVRAKNKNEVKFGEDVAYAQRILKAVLNAYDALGSKTNDRHVKPDTETKLKGLAVLNRANLGEKPLACLCEMEFIDNPDVDALLNTNAKADQNKDTIAAYVAKALVESLPT